MENENIYKKVHILDVACLLLLIFAIASFAFTLFFGFETIHYSYTLNNTVFTVTQDENAPLYLSEHFAYGLGYAMLHDFMLPGLIICGSIFIVVLTALIICYVNKKKIEKSDEKFALNKHCLKTI